MSILTESPEQLGYSKNKFVCALCNQAKYAHEFEILINYIAIRGFKIFCISCIDDFNLLSNEKKSEIVWKKLKEYCGENQFIYGLYEPDEGNLRYIGRTNSIKTRFQRHLQQGNDFLKKLKDENFIDYALDIYFYSSKKWVADLKLNGKKPEIKILETVSPTPKVYEQEMGWICQSIKEGEEILNVENNYEDIKKLISSCNFSFKTVSMDYLKRINFVKEIYTLTSHMNRESGWEKAFLVHEVFNKRELFAKCY